MLAIAAIIVGFLVMAYRWFLLLVLWGWFIVPSLNLPNITYWQMAGVSLFWSMFVFKLDEKDRNAKEVLMYGIKVATGMSIFMGLAWLVKLML